MDCRQIASQLCRLSADDLPSSTAVAMWEHLTRCPECEQEWEKFQATLHVLSSAPQPLITSEQSAQIWQHCSEKLHQRIEERRLAAQRPAFFSWARSQPRWGWAALGGAVAVLGGVWWLTPQESPDTLDSQIAQILPRQAGSGHAARSLATSVGMIGMNEAPSPGPLVTFQRPPAMASAMVNNHAEMAFDPFIDHVGTGLVSNAALTHQVSVGESVAPLPAGANDIAPASAGGASNGAAPANGVTDANAAPGAASNAELPSARNLTGANPRAVAPPVAPAPNAAGQTP